MRLVFVHGRAQEGQVAEVLKTSWTDALVTGLDAASVSLPAGSLIELPYYGNTLARLVQQVHLPLGLEINAKGPNPDDSDLRGQLILEMAAAAGVSDADVRAMLNNHATAKGPANWEWVQAALRALDRVPGMNSVVIDAVTRDVYVYLRYFGVRQAVDGIVGEAIGTDECVVVAHSLGTVVAYNVLMARAATPPVRHFITLGSPLGINGIKRKLAQPLRRPACVANWFNAYDDRDVVALAPLDRNHFDVTPAILNRNSVQNFTANRHGIEGYLSDPVVARTIAEAMV